MNNPLLSINPKNFLFFSSFFLVVTISYSQKSDYIATDSSASHGINILKSTRRDNSQFIILKTKGNNIKYMPDDLIEYGFKDGTIYESHLIQIDGKFRNVFLERLVQGKMKLYRYTDKAGTSFYIQKDSIQLTRVLPDLEAFRINSDDCIYLDDAIRLASYKEASLSKLVERYNTCINRPFPYLKIGIMAGLSQLQLSISSGSEFSGIAELKYNNSNSLLFGVFTDIPIRMSDFSFHPELTISKSGYSGNTKINETDIDVVVNLTTLNIPILVRYTYPGFQWRPFINAGYLVSYNIQNEGDIYESRIINNAIIINKPVQSQLIPDVMMGFSIGAGIQYNLNYRKTLTSEIRYVNSFGSEKSYGQNGFNLLIGFTF